MSPNFSSDITRSWLSRNNFKCCRYGCFITDISLKSHSQAALFSNANSGQSYGYPLFPSSGAYSNASPENLSYPKTSPEQTGYSRSPPENMSYPSSSPENLSTSVGSNHQQEKSATPHSSPSASPGEGGDGEHEDDEEEDEDEEESKPEYSNLAAALPHQSYPTLPQFSGFPSYQQTFQQV